MSRRQIGGFVVGGAMIGLGAWLVGARRGGSSRARDTRDHAHAAPAPVYDPAMATQETATATPVAPSSFSFGPSGCPTIAAKKICEDSPMITRWQGAVAAAAAAHGVPPAFPQAWLTIESGGNLCAVGQSTATGPDGFPREVGPFQAYNPDDFKALGLRAGDFVMGVCARPSIGPQAHKEDDGGYLDGTEKNPQRELVALTPEVARRHAELGLGVIGLKRHTADHYLAGNHITWATSSPDYWALVKAVHAWPPIVNTGLYQVTHALGRPPISWAEFRQTYERIQPLAKFDPVKAAQGVEQSPYFRGLENAEWTGFHVVPSQAVA